MKALQGIVIAIGWAGVATGALAGPDPVQAPAVTRDDARFFEQAVQGGLAEVEISKLAVERSKNPAVKEFAQRMVDDHSRANQKLMELASNKGAAIPSKPDARHREALRDLRKKEGSGFDEAYLELMESDHDHAVDLFEDAARRTKDAEIRSFVADTLPTLKHHHEMVKSVHDRAGN